MLAVLPILGIVSVAPLQDEDAGGEAPGSEYMASSIVRGCPDECLSVLVDLSSNTTILGPASKIELLEDGEERQVCAGTGGRAVLARHFLRE